MTASRIHREPITAADLAYHLDIVHGARGRERPWSDHEEAAAWDDALHEWMHGRRPERPVWRP